MIRLSFLTVLGRVGVLLALVMLGGAVGAPGLCDRLTNPAAVADLSQ